MNPSDRFENACGANGEVWARGNGWALLGLVETLRYLPENHSARRELIERLTLLSQGLRKTQAFSGLWHTVIPNPATYEESTLAAMNAYTLREAVAGALLPEAPSRQNASIEKPTGAAAPGAESPRPAGASSRRANTCRRSGDGACIHSPSTRC